MSRGITIRRLSPVALIVGFLASLPAGPAGPSAARAEAIILSNRSSDATPPEALSAVLDFSVEGDVLTLVVSNLTPPFPWMGGYSIDRILFNAPDAVTDLSLPSGYWVVDQFTYLPGFGTFDFEIRPRTGMDMYIMGESSETFVLQISGTGPYTEAEFAAALSTPAEGEEASLGAAWFFWGPGGDAAWGITVPPSPPPEVIPLSNRSSDETPPGALSAQLSFSVQGDALSLTVSNLTPPFPWMGGYTINRILFNSGCTVTDLALSPGEWVIDRNVWLAGYGIFDYEIRPRTGIDVSIPGESGATFELQILGAGPFSASDFSTALTDPDVDEEAALAAAWFYDGPGGDNAWGINAPPPNPQNILLSNRSSDQTPPEDLAAQLSFEIDGDLVYLAAINLTPPPGEGGYAINRILFNVSDAVTGLSMASDEWELVPQTALPGYGIFDFEIRPQAGSGARIEGEGAAVFILQISGPGPFTAGGFAEALSVAAEGETPGFAAAWFFDGPGGDDAWGIAVPASSGVDDGPVDEAGGGANDGGANDGGDGDRPASGFGVAGGASLRLALAGPNPCPGAAQFVLDLREARGISAAICDAAGRRVRTLLDGPADAGRHSLRWEGRDASGAPVPSGIYFLSARGAGRGEAAAVRFVLLRR
jgi:hypothetical protein